MAKLKNRHLVYTIIAVILLIIVGSVFALMQGKDAGFKMVNFGQVNLKSQEVFENTINLQNVGQDDVVLSNLKFTNSDANLNSYARVGVWYFSKDDDLEDLVKELNEGIGSQFYSKSSKYQWSNSYNNYYYLLDAESRHNAYRIESLDSVVAFESLYIKASDQILKRVVENSDEISLHIEINLVDSNNVDAVLTNVDEKFEQIYGYSAEVYSLQNILKNVNYGVYPESSPYAGKYYIEMGQYPQTLVTDSGVIQSLTLVENKTYRIDGAECLIYTDGDCEYISFTANKENNSYVDPQSDFYSMYQKYEGVHYYKIEPVRWLVIGQADGSALPEDFKLTDETLKSVLVISESILVQSIFNQSIEHITPENSYTFNDWSGSFVRSYMNGDLYNSLFNMSEQLWIQDVSLHTTYKKKDSGVSALNTTGDKLFLLGVNNQSGNIYGDNYLVNLLNNSEAKIGGTYEWMLATSTDLSNATGVRYNADTGCGHWWLRTGYDKISKSASYSCRVGCVSCLFVDSDYAGLRPALILGG